MAKIVRCRHSNAQQLQALTRKMASISPPASPSSSCQSSRATSAKTSMSSSVPALISSNTLTRCCAAKLTDLEKDWLNTNNSCFRCYRPNADHFAMECTNWASADYVVPVPKGWTKGATDNSAAAILTVKNEARIRVVHTFSDDEDIELPESLMDDSESDGYALPPLSLRMGSRSLGRLADALADSSSTVSLISEKLAVELGLKSRS